MGAAKLLPPPLPEPKVYSPRLRRDQIRAFYYLKRFEGRPMTKLVGEAVDRSLEQHGGAADLIARGIAEFGDREEEAHHERGRSLTPTSHTGRRGLAAASPLSPAEVRELAPCRTSSSPRPIIR